MADALGSMANRTAPPIAAPPPPGLRPSLAARRAAVRLIAEGAVSAAQAPEAAAALEAAAARALGLGTERVRARASGSGSLLEALLSAGAGPGRVVALSPLAPPYVAGAVALTGARPVAADVDPDILAPPPERLKSLAGRRTAALLWTPPPALPEPLPSLGDLLALGPRVVEDAAHLFGLRDRDGKAVGARAFAGAFSLAYGKALAAGEGGLTVAAAPEAAARLRRLRQSRLPLLAAAGRLAPPLAALAAVDLGAGEERWRRRRAVAARLAAVAAQAGVESLPTPGLPPWAGRFPTAAAARRAGRRAARVRLELVPPPHWGDLRALPGTRDAVGRVRLLAWWDTAAAREAELALLLRAFAYALGVAA